MITFITGNQNKFKEVKVILGGDLIMCDIDLPEIQTLSVEEVVATKLREARKHVPDGSIMVDDTGYYFESLGKLPGVFSKFFLEELGHAGAYDLVSRLASANATVYTCIGYMDEQDTIKFFIADVQGTIVSPTGEHGFGFDSLFIPQGYTTTLAQMEVSAYATTKPRGKAVSLLKEFLSTKK